MKLRYSLSRFSAVVSIAALSFSTTVFADLSSDVVRTILKSPLTSAKVSVSIRNADTDESLVAYKDKQPMIPASNMKLLTTGTALHVLGGDFEFQTQLLLVDEDRLIILGDGDPGFGDPELLKLLVVGEQEGVDVEQFLDLWVKPVKERGIKTIREIVVDDRVFDREFVHETWPKEQLNRRYCAEVSGLIFHLNILNFYPKPVPGNKPDISEFEPYASWIGLDKNLANSRPDSRSGNTFSIARPFESNKLTFYGNVKTQYRTPVSVTLHNTPEFFAHLLASRLQKAGVEVLNYRVASEAEFLDNGEIIAPIVRTPISTIVTRCNRDSQNLYAEALLKRCGFEISSGTQAGSWSNGSAAVRLVAADRFANKSIISPLVVADGSGMSRDNRVSAGLLTAWLDTFHRDEIIGPIFINSLAVGNANGTLKDRFKDPIFKSVQIQAKSGYINQVSCLSGYVTTPDGRRRSFSILINDFGSVSVRSAKALQEDIVKKIVEDILAEEPVEIGG